MEQVTSYDVANLNEAGLGRYKSEVHVPYSSDTNSIVQGPQTQDKTSQGHKVPRHKVQLTKRPTGLTRTKRPKEIKSQGQNVPRTKRPKGQNVLHYLTSFNKHILCLKIGHIC